MQTQPRTPHELERQTFRCSDQGSLAIAGRVVQRNPPKLELDSWRSFGSAHLARQCPLCRAVVAPDFLLPHIPTTQTLETGQISHLTTLVGEPDLQILILFLARTDVRSSRNGLWRIRKRLEPLIEEPFRSWLTFGRTRRYGPESFLPENLHRAWYSVKNPNPYQYGPKIEGGAVF
jgi:hypothetical protein